MKLFCGIDWAEAHHDVAIVDENGQLVAKKRITDDPAGFAELIETLTTAGDNAEDPIPVAIETPRGLLVASLRATGRAVYSINPLAVARYRQRHSVARAKSDHADAMTLANILRVDAHLHRRLPADTELCRASLANSTGARVLAEIGDDRARFADARALKAYAGSAPITRASGRSVSITHRRIKNDRLAAAGWIWAFAAAAHCESARDHYRRRKEQGDRHAAAQRHLFNKLIGQLYHCLQNQQQSSEAKAFPLAPRIVA
jgi:transposase